MNSKRPNYLVFTAFSLLASFCVCASDDPVAPSCEISVSPSQIQLGQSVTFTLTTSGEITEATIGEITENAVLEHPVVGNPATLTITPFRSGWYLGWGTVNGPGGTGYAECETEFQVQ